MALDARLYRSDPSERRTVDRYAADFGATLRAPDRGPIDVTIQDLSTAGFRMETTVTLPIGAIVWIGIAGMQTNAAAIMRRDEGGYGCRFVTPVAASKVSAALNLAQTVVDAPWRRIDEDDRRPAARRTRRQRMSFAILLTGLGILLAVALFLLL